MKPVIHRLMIIMILKGCTGMSKKNLVILLICAAAGLAVITASVAVLKPDINKSVVLQIIKYKK